MHQQEKRKTRGREKFWGDIATYLAFWEIARASEPTSVVTCEPVEQ